MVIEFARDIFIPLGQAGADAFDDTRSWIDGNNRRLSDRLWLARQSDRNAIDAILRGAIVSGDDPLKAARRLEDYLLPAGRPVRDPKTGRLVKWRRDAAGNLLRDASGRLIPAQPKGTITRTPRSGAGSYAARRLARTEVSRAFAEGTRQSGQLNPFAEGLKWNKSGSHRGDDICDRNAAGSSPGMPAGVYRVGEEPTMPGHPQCICYWTIWTSRDAADIVAQLRSDFDLDPQAVRIVEISRPRRARELVTALFRAARALATREAA